MAWTSIQKRFTITILRPSDRKAPKQATPAENMTRELVNAAISEKFRNRKTVLAIKIGQVWPMRKKYPGIVVINSLVGSVIRFEHIPKYVKYVTLNSNTFILNFRFSVLLSFYQTEHEQYAEENLSTNCYQKWLFGRFYTLCPQRQSLEWHCLTHYLFMVTFNSKSKLFLNTKMS